jgi:LacI family transcriptional regulator
MRTIADLLNVSTVTVSKALNGKEGVSRDVREQIARTAKDLGYRPNPSAKAVKDGKSSDIGIVIADHFLGDSTFYASLYKRLVQQLTQMGYYGILEVLSNADEEGNTLPSLVESGKVDALVVVGQIRKAYIQRLVQVRIPYLFLDFYDEHTGVEAIVSDGIHGTYLLTNHLIQQGHREIGYIGDIRATSSIMDRYLGYTKSLLEHGLPIDAAWTLTDRDDHGRFTDVLLPDRLPSAFVCNCDETAYRLIQQLARRGVSVPGQVSIVGFDDYLGSTLCDPPLTTFRVNQHNMAKMAAEEIVQKVQGRSRKNGRIVIEGEIVYRNSVRQLIG